MRLSKAGYYSDFYVYPIVILGLTASALMRASLADAAAWLGATLAGLVIWTLLEYAMHRVAFHRIAIFIPLHDEHHRAPLAYRLPLVDRLRAWHLRHHYSKSAGNFGVTTTFWDYVFRTALAARSLKQG
jgi:sterol desaturase/sphingolipid hydroxylase (fatty acid hydroxylase superfamily)